MHQVSLRWPQEVARMILVKLVASLEGVAVGRDKWQRVGVENW
jgi:hypothetical protein